MTAEPYRPARLRALARHGSTAGGCPAGLTCKGDPQHERSR